MANYHVNMGDMRSAILTISKTKADGTRVVTLLTPPDVEIKPDDIITHPQYTNKENKLIEFKVFHVLEERPSIGNWRIERPTWRKLITK